MEPFKCLDPSLCCGAFKGWKGEVTVLRVTQLPEPKTSNKSAQTMPQSTESRLKVLWWV